MTTCPLTFDGDDLVLNFSTSAAGRILVEIQEPDGSPIDGFTLGECVETVGDELARTVHWSSGKRPGAIKGTAVRLKFVLVDSDLYSIKFA